MKSYFGGLRSLTVSIVAILAISTGIVLMEDTGSEGLLTVAGGSITSDTTWRLTDSPVNIEGNLSISGKSNLRKGSSV